MRKLLLLAAMLLPATAMAQYSRALPKPPDDSNVQLNAPGILEKKRQAAGLPEVKAQPQAWPRLDPGAVICRSEADLARLANRRRGEPVEGPVDCQPVRAATAITVLQRKGPGQTQVRTTDPAAGGVGWTDAWLPDKAPANARSAAR